MAEWIAGGKDPSHDAGFPLAVFGVLLLVGALACVLWAVNNSVVLAGVLGALLGLVGCVFVGVGARRSDDTR